MFVVHNSRIYVVHNSKIWVRWGYMIFSREERDGDDGVVDSGRREEAAVDVGGEVGGGGGGEGGAGGSLFSFHVEPGFFRDGGSVGDSHSPHPLLSHCSRRASLSLSLSLSLSFSLKHPSLFI